MLPILKAVGLGRSLAAGLMILIVVGTINRMENLDEDEKSWLTFLVLWGSPCSYHKFIHSYGEMRYANCTKCDDYFHCKANYNAVHKCEPVGELQGHDIRVLTAKVMSDWREHKTNDAEDSAKDQVANLHGRSGGNCEERFLKAVNCAWDVKTQWCGDLPEEMPFYKSVMKFGLGLFG